MQKRVHRDVVAILFHGLYRQPLKAAFNGVKPACGAGSHKVVSGFPCALCSTSTSTRGPQPLAPASAQNVIRCPVRGCRTSSKVNVTMLMRGWCKPQAPCKPDRLLHAPGARPHASIRTIVKQRYCRGLAAAALCRTTADTTPSDNHHRRTRSWAPCCQDGTTWSTAAAATGI